MTTQEPPSIAGAAFGVLFQLGVAFGLLATIALCVGSAVSSAVGTWGRAAKSRD